jgi:hypothetical protein
MTTHLKCAGCGEEWDVETVPRKKFICPVCGAVNTVVPADIGTAVQACGCLLPAGFEWKIPAGKIQTPFGDLYATADDGEQLSRLDWINDFGVDPKTLWENKKKLGVEGMPGFKNLSTLERKK